MVELEQKIIAALAERSGCPVTLDTLLEDIVKDSLDQAEALFELENIVGKRLPDARAGLSVAAIVKAANENTKT